MTDFYEQTVALAASYGEIAEKPEEGLEQLEAAKREEASLADTDRVDTGREHEER